MRFLKSGVAAMVLIWGAVAVYAGPYEDGLEAVKQRDFVTAAKLFREAAE